MAQGKTKISVQGMKEFYIKHRFWCNLALLLVLYFGHCFWGNMMYVVFPILALFVLFDDLKNGISYIIFSIPFCFLNIFMSAILFLSCVVIYVLKFYFIKFFKEKEKPKLGVVIPIAVFVLYCVAPIGNYNVDKLVRILEIVSLLIALRMITSRPDIFRFHHNIKMLGLGLLVSSIYGLTYFCSAYLQGYMVVIHISDRLIRYMALCYHTNVFAMLCEIVLSILAYYIISKKFTKDDVVLFACLALAGVFTFSKTYLLTVSFIILVIFICRLFCDFKKTALVGLGAAVLVVVLYFVMPTYFNTMLNRFAGQINDCQTVEDYINMFTTQRYDLWVEYATYIGKNPLVLVFGRGLGAPVLSTLSAHNAYICSVYEFGLVGVGLLIVTVAFIIRESVVSQNFRFRMASILPLVVIASILVVEDLVFYINP
jgi:hypothetical protein